MSAARLQDGRKSELGAEVDSKDLYGGLIRLHILHHASRGPIFGLWIIEELREHGYRLSPGTVYPMLHGLETKGYLRSSEERQGKRTRRVYRLTSRGNAALLDAKTKVQELFGELFEEGPPAKITKPIRRARRDSR